MGKGDGREKGLCPRRKRSFTKKEQKKNSTISKERGLLPLFCVWEILAFRDVSGATFLNSDPLKWELIEEVDKLKSCQPFLSELQEERSSQSPRQLHNETLDCWIWNEPFSSITQRLVEGWITGKHFMWQNWNETDRGYGINFWDIYLTWRVEYWWFCVCEGFKFQRDIITLFCFSLSMHYIQSVIDRSIQII